MGKKSRHAPADGGGLTPKQQAFTRNYATGRMSAKDAAIGAGYSPTSARAQAYDLLRHPLVKAELERIGDQLRERTAYDAAACFDEAGVAMEFARKTKNANAFTRSVELRARLHGLLTDKQEITVALPSVANALAEARSRLSFVDNRALPAALLPMGCQDEPIDAECTEVSGT